MTSIIYAEISPSGKIMSHGAAQPETVGMQQSYMGGSIKYFGPEENVNFDPKIHYWDFELEVFKEQLNIEQPVSLTMNADGQDSVHFDFPRNTQVTINSIAISIDDDSGLTFTSDTPGVFDIVAIPPFPYRYFETKVQVNEI